MNENACYTMQPIIKAATPAGVNRSRPQDWGPQGLTTPEEYLVRNLFSNKYYQKKEVKVILLYNYPLLVLIYASEIK
jgi:hypothetical protein